MTFDKFQSLISLIISRPRVHDVAQKSDNFEEPETQGIEVTKFLRQ